MDAARTAWIVFGILALQALVWVPIILRMRSQRARMVAGIGLSGETWVIAPAHADYQGWHRRYGFARTMGTIGLTERRIVFRRPFGAEISIPLTEIRSASDTVTCGRLRHSDGNYLSLILDDGSEVSFRVKEQGRWLSELRERLGATGEAASR